uniref:Uncharacterized protein n=1 Tax=Siphoviridae sp. ct5op20 TaxID=2826295 RepID=A0A8S5NQ71_9CAUD|nr:MAG TPA: hypothetical protein [Siphoviridae sp. ct5op20]DAM79963.1 MAG TPA: hypothetical protein [Caudoviricetes sp.]
MYYTCIFVSTIILTVIYHTKSKMSITFMNFASRILY